MLERHEGEEAHLVLSRELVEPVQVPVAVAEGEGQGGPV
jgi:hypothetical protein